MILLQILNELAEMGGNMTSFLRIAFIVSVIIFMLLACYNVYKKVLNDYNKTTLVCAYIMAFVVIILLFLYKNC